MNIYYRISLPDINETMFCLSIRSFVDDDVHIIRLHRVCQMIAVKRRVTLESEFN